MEEKITKLSAQELLNKFYNFHLNELVSSWINISIFKSKDPNEVVGERVGPQVSRETMPMRIQIKAKEAVEQELKRFEQQKNILEAILKREAELKTFRVDKEIWQKK